MPHHLHLSSLTEVLCVYEGNNKQILWGSINLSDMSLTQINSSVKDLEKFTQIQIPGETEKRQFYTKIGNFQSIYELEDGKNKGVKNLPTNSVGQFQNYQNSQWAVITIDRTPSVPKRFFKMQRTN